MNSNYTGRTNRTLHEAFGPYTSHAISEKVPSTDWDGIAIVLGCIAIVCAAYALAFWSVM
jgi:hypothetical protein